MSDFPSPRSDAILGAHTPDRRRQIEAVRWVALGSVVLLIVLGLAWELRLAPLRGGTGALALKVLPLSLGITGLLKHRLYTFRWLSLLVWAYFTEGAARTFSDALVLSRALAGVEVLLSVTLFVACAVYVRLRLKVLPPKAKSAQKPAKKAGKKAGASSI